jgi:hypothetical protein
MNIDKIYYINLTEDTRKNNFFLNQVGRTCLKDKCERFNAINGKDIDINTITDSIITTNARNSIISQKQKVYGVSLTYGSLGCALSHKAIWEECSLSNKPYLIFEDDNVEYVLNLIKEKEHIELYEEEKPPVQVEEKRDIIRYVDKPKRKPKQPKVGD